MTDPTEPDAVRARLAGELAELSRRLEQVRAELIAWQPTASRPTTPGTPPPVPGTSAPVPGPPPTPAWAPRPGMPPWAPPPVMPGLAPHGGWTPPVAVPPVRGATRPEPRPAGVAGGRVLAWIGGAITLLGVVLLLVLATTRGWLGPEAGVVAGGVLGLALVCLGGWVHRKPEGRTGGLAVVGTGVAALYLDVAAASALYGFLPLWAGLLAALAVAAGGIGLADRWRSELLATGALLGAVLLAPALTFGVDWRLGSLTLALLLASVPAVWRRGWTVLAATAAGAAVLFAALAVPWSAVYGDEAATTVLACAVLLVTAGLAVTAGSRLPAALVIVLLLAAPVPALLMAVVLDRGPGTALAVAAALVLLGAAAIPWLPSAARLAATVAAGVAVFEATVHALDGASLTMVLLGESVVLAVLAALTGRRAPLAMAAGFGLVGLLLALARDVPLTALTVPGRRPFELAGEPQVAVLLAAAGVSALLLAAAVAGLVAAARLGLVRADAGSALLWAPVALVALYGGTGLVLTLAVLAAPGGTGFLVGHVIVTVSWTLAALVLLARGISRPALRVAGMVLVVAAVTKLLLFDLIALDGVARVVVFLGGGLVLLAAGSRYARLVARAKPS